jgi:hypothetical protein
MQKHDLGSFGNTESEAFPECSLIQNLPGNPLHARLSEALRSGVNPSTVRVSVEDDLPDSPVKSFLMASRRMDKYSVAVAGSRIRDLVMGGVDSVGDIDLAVGLKSGRPKWGFHEDIFRSDMEKSKEHFQERLGAQKLADMIHFSCPHLMHKKEDGRWVFRKTTMAAQYTFDYVGLKNDGQIIDPYGGIKDMLSGLIRLDFLNPQYAIDYSHNAPGAPAFSMRRALPFETVLRGLFPKHKWGAAFEPETERIISNHQPMFSGSDYELSIFSRLCHWVKSPTELMGDLRRYHLIEPLSKASQDDTKDYESGNPHSKKIRAFTQSLPGGIGCALEHEMRKIRG